MSFPIARRRRRRRGIVLVVIVGLAVTIGLALTRFRSDSQLTREFLDTALEVAIAEERLAGRFSALVTGLGEVGRPTMVATLEELEVAVTTLAERVEAIDVPEGEAGIIRSHVLLSIAAGRWRDGVRTTRQGILTLTEEPTTDDDVGIALLGQGLSDVRVGDSAYSALEEVLAGQDTSLVAGEFPSVRFIPPAEQLAFLPTEVARRIFLTPTLEVLVNLAISDLRIDPGPVADRDGVPLIPLSDQLDVEVVVANPGNVAVTEILVQLDLVSNEGDVFNAEQEIASLEPGALTGVTFADLPVEAGKLYEVVVSLPLEDDDPTDDEASYVFIRNEAG